MIYLSGIMKVWLVLLLDFLTLSSVLGEWGPAAGITGVAALYVWLGGYLGLYQEGAVRWDRLPVWERQRLEAAKSQLAQDVRQASGVKLARLKLYLSPDDTLNATAYGAGCISVTRGTLNSADPLALNGVLAHEISHTLHRDAEFSRALLVSITLLLAAISIISFVIVLVVFLLFLVFTGFRSWLGVLAFRGTATAVGRFFRFIQWGIAAAYQALFGLVSRRREYRSDRYAAALGYGLPLAHFLSAADPGVTGRLTLSQVLYRSHPPVENRIARLEALAASRRGN